jgi:hypothetical protein
MKKNRSEREGFRRAGRHAVRMLHGGDQCQRRGADRRIGGPRYLLAPHLALMNSPASEALAPIPRVRSSPITTPAPANRALQKVLLEVDTKFSPIYGAPEWEDAGLHYYWLNH